MQVRCQNCGARLSVPPGEPRQIKCPRCGVSILVPPPQGDVAGEGRGPFRRSQASLKRVYEPIPRPMVYLVGAGIALLLTSPFWIYVLREKYSRRPPVLADDTRDLITTSPAGSSATSSPLLGDRESGTFTFDRYRSVRLDAGREDLQTRFNLRLQNTRGMVPEIYEAERAGDVEQITAYFYGNALKEFSLVLRQRRMLPDDVQKELVEQFGEPHQVQESANAAGGLGVGLPGLAANSDGLAQKLAAFSKRRDLTWADDQNRVEATIYYNATDALLSVRVSAAAWLKTNHPLVNPAAPAVSNAFDRPVLPNTPAARTFP